MYQHATLRLIVTGFPRATGSTDASGGIGAVTSMTRPTLLLMDWTFWNSRMHADRDSVAFYFGLLPCIAH